MGINYWTGIGSRDITQEEYQWAVLVGEQLTRRYGMILRSGGAGGADTAFQHGVCNVDFRRCEIWIPWEGFLPEQVHPDFGGCEYIVAGLKRTNDAEWFYTEHTNIMPWFSNMKASNKLLHGRNYYQVVGKEKAPKSSVCIFIADENSNGDISGGTRSAVLVARHYKIPTYNLRNTEQREKLFSLIGVEYA